MAFVEKLNSLKTPKYSKTTKIASSKEDASSSKVAISKNKSKKNKLSKFKRSYQNKPKKSSKNPAQTSQNDDKNDLQNDLPNLQNNPQSPQSLVKRPICFNYEKPCKDCVKPVEFGALREVYALGDDIQLDYSLMESFTPRTGDWVGLFRLCRDIEKCFEFSGFRWAQKDPSYKNHPLKRSLVFYPSDLEVSTEEGSKYVFLYLSTNERILGQSSTLTFKVYTNKVNENSLAKKMVSYAVASAIDEMKKSSSNLIAARQVEDSTNKDAINSMYFEDDDDDENWIEATSSKNKLKKKRRNEKKIEIQNKTTLNKTTPNKPTPNNTTPNKTTPNKTPFNIITQVTQLTPTTSLNTLKTLLTTHKASINIPKAPPPSSEMPFINVKTSDNNHVAKMIGMFEQLISRESELKERMEKMENTNLALILSQQLMHQHAHTDSCPCFKCNPPTHKLNDECECMECLEAAMRQQESCQCPDCLRETMDRLNLKDSRSTSGKQSIISDKKKNKKCTFGAKNLHYYHPTDDIDINFSEVTSANEYEDRRKLLTEKLFEKVHNRYQSDNTGIKIRKAVTEIADLLKEMGREEEILMSRSVQHNSMYKQLFDNNLEEAKRNLKADKSMIQNIRKKRNNLSSVYSGSFVGLNKLFGEDDVKLKGKGSKKGKTPNFKNSTFTSKASLKEMIKNNDLQVIRLKPDIPKANYSIRLMYGNKHDISASVPDMTLKKLFEDIYTNEALIVDVAKDRSILIQPFNNDDDSFCPHSTTSFPEKSKKDVRKNRLEVINEVSSSSSKDSNKSNLKAGPNLFTTTSNVLDELKKMSRQEKIFTSSSYPSRITNTTKNRLEEIQNLLNSCFSNDLTYLAPSQSSQSSYSGKLSDFSMKVQRGSVECANSPLVQSPAVTKLTLLDSFDILSPAYRETNFQNTRLKKDHSAKLMLITNILESNMTDENKILTLKQIMEACPILSQLEKNSRKQFSPVNHKTRTRFSDIVQTEHETSDSFSEVEKEEDNQTFYFSKRKTPLKRPVLKIGTTLRRKRRSTKSKKKIPNSKFTQTEYIVKRIAEKKSEEKRNSNFPRLIRKPMLFNSESKTSVDDESRMKPILKKSSHALRPCQISRRSSLNFLNNLPNDFDLQESSGKHAGSSKQTENDEAGNFKRERKVSFNTIILTSLFENEDADKDEVTKKDIKHFVASSGKSTWPDKEENDVSALQQFINLLEREVQVVTDNAFEIQNSISKAVSIFKDEAIKLKNKYSQSLGNALRAMSPTRYEVTKKKSPTFIEMKSMAATLADHTARIVKLNHDGKKKIAKSISIDRINTTSKQHTAPLTHFNLGSLTNNKMAIKVETEKQNEVDNNEEYPLFPVTRKNKLKAPVSPDDIKIYFNKELEIQMILDNVLKENKDEQSEKLRNIPECLRIDPFFSNKTSDYEEARRSDKLEVKKLPVMRKKLDGFSSNSIKFSDYWDEREAVLAQISDNSLNSDAEIFSRTPVVSLYSEASNNSMLTNARPRSFYSNGTQFSRLSEYDAQSMCHSHSNPSLNIIQSFDSTISSIVKLYNNITNYVYNQPPIHPTHYCYPDDKVLRDELLNNSRCPNQKDPNSGAATYLLKDLPSCVSRDYNELVWNLKKKLSDKSSSEDQKDESYEEMLRNIHETILPISEKLSSYASKVAKNVENNDAEEVEMVEDSPENIEEENEFCLTCSEEFPSLKATVEKVINKFEKEKINEDATKRKDIVKNKKKKNKKD